MDINLHVCDMNTVITFNTPYTSVINIYSDYCSLKLSKHDHDNDMVMIVYEKFAEIVVIKMHSINHV